MDAIKTPLRICILPPITFSMKHSLFWFFQEGPLGGGSGGHASMARGLLSRRSLEEEYLGATLSQRQTRSLSRGSLDDARKRRESFAASGGHLQHFHRGQFPFFLLFTSLLAVAKKGKGALFSSSIRNRKSLKVPRCTRKIFPSRENITEMQFPDPFRLHSF